MERISADDNQKQLYDEFVELCKIADQGGMHAIWTGEHHGMNFTIAPNPLLNLVDIANHTEHVRLGTGTLVAPFWHPIRLAGEAAMTDNIINGRLELSIARGAYSFEYDRLGNGMDAMEAGQHLREMIPAVRGLWAGDYEHHGQFHQFPKTTSSPKPLQDGGPPIWIAAREANSHEFAVSNGCNVQVTPLWKGDQEIADLMDKFNHACQRFSDQPRPKIMLLQNTYVAASEADCEQAAYELNRFYCYFGAWFMNKRNITQGVIEPLSEEELASHPIYSPQAMRRDLVIEEPAGVIERLKKYAALGYDEYSFWIDSSMTFARKKASLERFINEVMPAFK
jgi:alkanesulfonate monooxygenase SsuD/methylene tetrahydromethanopterin reductase-like flavin-dependent oxidoreductase (luciferase family)